MAEIKKFCIQKKNTKKRVTNVDKLIAREYFSFFINILFGVVCRVIDWFLYLLTKNKMYF